MIDVVQSVDRAFSILEVISQYQDGLGISEISEKVGLHKSTVHRLLGTLIYKGFVIQDDQTNRYKISLKLYEIGVRKIADVDILKVSRSYTSALMEIFNEVVHLVIRDHNEIIYIDKVEADNTIRMASTIGRRSPLYCTSVGKVILAYLQDEEVRNIWETSTIIKLTDHTIVDFNHLLVELEKIRSLGYAEDDEENEFGVRCIAAPVFNSHGLVEGAISISGPTTRVTKDKVSEIAEEVKICAKLISRDLGYIG